MSYFLTVRPIADQDIDEIASVLADDNLSVGLRFYDSVQKTFRKIASNPQHYAVLQLEHPRLQGIRKCSVIGFRNHLIFFRVERDRVDVIRVLHGARDLSVVLSQ